MFRLILLFCLLSFSALADGTLTPLPSGITMCQAGIAAGVNVDMSACKTGMVIPVGTTGDRPSSPVAGTFRWNTDIAGFEDWNGSAWVQQLPMSFNTAAAANGFQVSSTRNSLGIYNVLITVTASITSGQSGYVVFEICPTNSAIAGNWIEIGRTSSSQVYTLAVALQGVQGAGASLVGMIPAGYYARLRSVNVTGTPSYAYISGQEAQF